MEAAKVTFLGGEEVGADVTTWGNLTFKVGEPVVIDPAKAPTQEDVDLWRHIIHKAAMNRFFAVERTATLTTDELPAHSRLPVPKPRAKKRSK